MEHTATPWNFMRRSASDRPIICAENEAKDICALSMQGKESNEVWANAEFIVRACNAHDDLVHLLKQVTDSLETALQLHVPSDEANLMWPVLCQQARAALAKAGVA